MSEIPLSGQSVFHAGRLEALQESQLLDSLEEDSFDRFTRLAKAILGAEISLISLVDRDRQFFKSQCGLGEPVRSQRQTPLTHSFCRHVVENGAPLIVENAREDQRVRDNPAVSEFGVLAYLGVPLATRDGHILGSLCAIETHPRAWSDEDLASLYDLASAVMRELELSMRAAALKHALSASESRSNRWEREMRTITHDLRTPAGAISSCLEMLFLESENFTAENLELLQISQESAVRLLDMIQQILEIDQITSAGGGSLKIEPVSASLLVARVSRVIRPFADDARVTLDIVPVEEIIHVKADSRLIERCLLNLLTNAVKYSPSGSTIQIRIQHEDQPGPPLCRITVSDQGPGVPNEEKAQIFEQFVTGSKPGERGMTSFGIGLSFCKSVIESHGGRIGVTDAPGGGSEFFLLLPE